MKTLKFLFVFLFLISFFESVAQSSGIWIVYQGKDVYLPSDYCDPDYPKTEISLGYTESPAYTAYLRDHLFPMLGDENYTGKLENWWKHNIWYYPQYLPTGNTVFDSVRLIAARAAWVNVHEDLFIQLSEIVSNFSIEDFDLLYATFPLKPATANSERDEIIYMLEVEEWIRNYSLDKYEQIAPLMNEL